MSSIAKPFTVILTILFISVAILIIRLTNDWTTPDGTHAVKATKQGLGKITGSYTTTSKDYPFVQISYANGILYYGWEKLTPLSDGSYMKSETQSGEILTTVYGKSNEYIWKESGIRISKIDLKDIDRRESVKIDNFDKADFNALTNGKWKSYDDSYSGGKSIDSLEYLVDSITKNQSLHFSYILDKGKFDHAYSWFQLNFSPDQIPDGTFDGIMYEFKGDKHIFKYATSNIKDYAFYEQYIAGSQDWTTVIIPFNTLTIPSWGKDKKAPFNADLLTSLLWCAGGITGDKGNVTIDNVRFYRSK